MKLPAWRRSAAAVLCMGLAASLAPSARACSSQELANFKAAAQQLDKAGAALGDQLRRCPATSKNGDMAEQALQWQAFLTSKTKSQAAAQSLDAPLVAKSGREGVLARARAGSYQELLGKIDEQDSELTTSPEAQLVLARALTRKGLFTRGREAYLFYLKLAPDNDDAEVERLYSYLWQGDLPQAADQFAVADGWSARSAYKEAVARGRALLARLGGSSAPPTSSIAGEHTLAYSGEVHANYGYFRNLDTYERRSAVLSYQGAFDLRLASHRIVDLGLTKDRMDANEVSAGATFGDRSSWHVALHGGYVSLGSDHYTGDVLAGLPLGLGLVLEAGTSETPLILQLPLSPDASGLMRDAVFAELRYPRWFELHLEVQKERDYKPHEKHRLLVRLPFLRSDEDDFALIAPVTYESYPAPIPDYDTDLLTWTAGVGFDLARTFPSQWRVSASAAYSFAFVTDRSLAHNTKQVGVFKADGSLVIPLGDLLHAGLDAHYIRAEDDDYERRHEALTSLVVSLGYGA